MSAAKPPQREDMIVIPRSEFETLLEQAACRGARKALKEVGLADEEAANDIRTLRDWIHACHIIKSEALKTIVSIVIKTIIMALVIGLAWLIGVRFGR